ncbi:malonate decarboxylase holo-[acyl-carrier-protein] synthase [Bradyrhizobium barranii subsp. barranii]
MAEALQRHTMVTASATGWSAAMSRNPALASEPIIEGWARASRPLVVRRPACNDPAGMIPLGLPLPPSHGKRRIAVALAPGELIAHAPPPLLADTAAAAPASWHRTIDLLVRLLPQTRTYGSLAWQHLTGLPYLSDGSDLDPALAAVVGDAREHPAVRHRADRRDGADAAGRRDRLSRRRRAMARADRR